MYDFSLLIIFVLYLSTLRDVAPEFPELPQLWEVHLGEKIVEPKDWNQTRDHAVIALAYSPNGQKLALTMDTHQFAAAPRTHLLIVDVRRPQDAPLQFDLETCGEFLSWSPDSSNLLFCGSVLRPGIKEFCRLPSRGGPTILRNEFSWLGPDRVIAFDGEISDLSCHSVDKWAWYEDWHVAGAIPGKGLIVLRRVIKLAGPLPQTIYAIADFGSRKPTSGIFPPSEWNASERLIHIEGVNAICSTIVAPDDRRWRYECWSLPGGELLPFPPALSDFSIADASRSSPRAVVERTGHSGLLIDGPPVVRESQVVDLRSGDLIVKLNPRKQRSRAGWDQYFRKALSPDGRLLAAAGDGQVALYQLP